MNLRWLTSPSTLRARIFWSLVPIFLVLFALVGVANVQLHRNLAEEQFRQRGVEIASNLAYSSELGVLAEDAGLLESSIRSVIGDPDVAYILVYDSAGKRLAQGGRADQVAPPAEADRKRLAEEGRPFSTDAIVRRRFMEFYSPIFSAAAGTPDELLLGLDVKSGKAPDVAVGFVRVGLSLDLVRHHTATLLRFWAGLFTAFIALALVAISFFSRRITRPINLLTARSEEIAAGNLNQEIPVGSRDEIGQLAATFNKMAQSLKATVTAKERAADELKELNQTLEERIRKRTAELEEMYRLSASMQEPLSLKEALSRVLDGARQLVGIDRVCIWAVTQDGKRLVPLSAAGVPDEDFAKLQETVFSSEDEGALARVLRTGAALLYEEGAAEPVEVRLEDAGTNPRLSIPASLFLLLPVLARGSAIGVLTCDSRQSRRPIGEATLAVLRTFAAHAASAIENAQLFQELEDKGREIQAANRHKSEFLANMSHELRTPLNAVIGFSEVLIERMFGDLTDKQEEYLNDILDSGRHLLSLINDILDLSKIEAGQMELAPSRFDLSSALSNAATLVKERAQRRGLKLVLDVTSCPESFVADERKFKQVMLNLLSNAVKFTEEGGTVTLRAVSAGDMVEFSVTDTGIGIAPGDQERIFEAFRQAEGEYVRKTEGTGLGLTLSRRIVELHGGRLRVESKLGVGSTFTCSLPIRGVASAEPAPQTRAAAGRLPADGSKAAVAQATATNAPPAEVAGNFVLVVENDQASANLLAIHLRDAGLEVRVAQDAKAGLEVAATLRPRAIVLDIHLPRLDGWDLLAQLRANPETESIPVVIVSITEDLGKGLALGAADYLLEPYDPEQLVKSVQRLCHVGIRAEQSTVLAIDDDPRTLELISATLEPQGLRVLKALSGEEGLEIARCQRPDLIVLDLMLPGLDGFEVAKVLKDDPQTADIPIVVLTFRSLSTAEKQRLAGRIAHLGRKSEFQREAFVAFVQKAIERR